ncbi:VanZ family protein [Lysobacter auxotrophicus]|uniref:VanZ family protein n=1 Tax=Lysobacter auxotrophicus TaxID=2992573 RepID=A0ABM8DI60_9GAMM|nr:VanZ family protein [Lysobacter auxotrophicus]BDU18336.1 VanZ family protein [Lysobacter auxotrophicus]
MSATTLKRPLLRGFRWPALWVAIWIAMIAAVVASSLLPAHDLPEVPDGFDKVEHFVGYFVLSAWAVMLFAQRRAQAIAAVGLIGLGIALEFAQGAWTVSRMADSADALANSLGVLAGLMLGPTPLGGLLVWVEGKMRR